MFEPQRNAAGHSPRLMNASEGWAQRMDGLSGEGKCVIYKLSRRSEIRRERVGGRGGS